MSMTAEIDSNDPERGITEDEAKLYDRQIRLWGVKSQKLLRQANVLCVGLSGLASEVVKNIVLAGINSLTIIEDEKVTDKDSLSNIFTRNKIDENRGKAAESAIKILNPMVKINILEWNVKEKISNSSNDLIDLIKKVDVVFITNYGKETISQLNNIVRSIENGNYKFFAACDWGFYGFSFTDCGKNYKFITEKYVEKEFSCEEPPSKKAKIEDKQEVILVEKELDFVPFSTALSIKAGKAGVGLTKRTCPVLILVHTLFEFESKFKRYPDNIHRESDIEELKKISSKVIEDLGVGEALLNKLQDEDCWNNIFGSISPVSSVVGAAVGQDIIRVISGKGVPIRNFFLFNGMQCNGFIESIRK